MVEEVPEANKLYRLIVDIGEEERQLLAGLKKYYKKEELIGKKVVVLVNLEPKEMFGYESQGMVLAAGKNTSLLTVDEETENGSRIS